MSRRSRAHAGRAPAAPAPGGAPALLDAVTRVALALAALAALVLVSDPIADPDLGQHLAVGRAIWATHAVPATQQWSWPTYGEPVVTPSWLFRALLWPFASAGGVPGLFAWRWLTTLAVGALAWATARRLGGTGVAAAVAIVVAVVGFRQRTQVRPETLAFVLLALELWLLARVRSGDTRVAWWLVAVAWAWANVHISYGIGLVVLAAFALDLALDGRPGARRRAAGLVPVGLAMAAVSFLNPFGWRALAQPFEYALVWSREPIFRSIGELARYDWAVQWRFLTPLVLVGWPLAALLRAALLRRLDRAEWLLLAGAVTLALAGQRFVGFLAVTAAPFLARDLSELACRLAPAAAARPAPRLVVAVAVLAALTAAPFLALGTRPALRRDPTETPVAACDFLDRAGVRGRGLSPFGFAGHLLERFGGERSRLPFMDIHQSGGPGIRAAYMAALTGPRGWRDLDARFRFDYALLGRRALAADGLLASLDGDPAFRLVFLDDVAAVYVRREGPLAEVARRHGYTGMPASRAGAEARVAEAQRDTARLVALLGECERAVAGSRANARALWMRAFLEMSQGRTEAGEATMAAVLAADPSFPGAHGWLGRLAGLRGDRERAERELATERRLHGDSPALAFDTGLVRLRSGDRAGAARAFRAALRLDPAHAAARDSLRALEGDSGD